MYGERLAEARKDCRLKQSDVAKVLEVSVTTISGYENNRIKPSIDKCVMMAKLFDKSLDYLLGASNEELSLNRSNEVTLPKELPKDVRDGVLEYVSYICQKYDKY